MDSYVALTGAGITTRAAARLSGVAKATAARPTRRRRTGTSDARGAADRARRARPCPVNRLSALERATV